MLTSPLPYQIFLLGMDRMEASGEENSYFSDLSREHDRGTEIDLLFDGAMMGCKIYGSIGGVKLYAPKFNIDRPG